MSHRPLMDRLGPGLEKRHMSINELPSKRREIPKGYQNNILANDDVWSFYQSRIAGAIDDRNSRDKGLC